jgi:uncharacterized membrane protein
VALELREALDQAAAASGRRRSGRARRCSGPATAGGKDCASPGSIPGMVRRRVELR